MGKKGKSSAKYPNKLGRKKRTFTEEEYQQIQKYSGNGLSLVQIAHMLEPPISEATIQRRMNDDERFASAIKKGRSKSVQMVANKVFENAMDGKETSAIFFLKTRDPERWNDRQNTEVNINLGEILDQAKGRIIDLTPERTPELPELKQARERTNEAPASVHAGADNNKQDKQSD